MILTLAHWRGMVIGSLLVVLASKVWWSAHQVGVLTQRNATLSQQLQTDETRLRSQQEAIITNAAIDSKYTQELAHDQSEINHLRADVESGHRQLHISANCGGSHTTTASMADATGPRPTDAAQQNYFTLTGRIALASRQIAGLQAYITNVLNQPQIKDGSCKSPFTYVKP